MGRWSGLAEAVGEGGRVEEGAALASCTTLKVGGAAEVLAEVGTLASLRSAVGYAQAAGARWWVLGSGSNLLVSDAGVSGLALRLVGEFVGATLEGEEAVIGGGTWNAHAVRALHQRERVGLEFLALVPGSFGGAVAMNAGTRWGQLSERLVSATCLLASGEVVELGVEALGMGYRACSLPPGAVVVSGRARVEAGDAAAAKERIREEKAYRSRTQPYQAACAGSFFANPPGDAAGRLIEAAGLKGLRWGGAEVSGLHANFIVNAGGAQAAEVVTLMALARRVVGERFGVWLRPEVRLVGFGDEGAAAVLDGWTIPPELASRWLGR